MKLLKAKAVVKLSAILATINWVYSFFTDLSKEPIFITLLVLLAISAALMFIGDWCKSKEKPMDASIDALDALIKEIKETRIKDKTK